MASKTIVDSPALLNETLLTIPEACQRFPHGPFSRSTLEQWIRTGSRGAVLESVYFCGKRWVSEEGISRFLRNQQRLEVELDHKENPSEAIQEASETRHATMNCNIRTKNKSITRN